MSGRRRNPRLAKTHYSYSIIEAASLYGVHRQTVRQWIANGLTPIDTNRPVLIHGTTLNAFHAARRATRRRSCGPLELYCLRCREPRKPAGDMADYLAASDKVGTLSAICPECGRLMTQRVNASGLALFRAALEVSIRPAPQPISESAQCSPKPHLEKGSITHENQRRK
jgi:hypothetical protein